MVGSLKDFLAFLFGMAQQVAGAANELVQGLCSVKIPLILKAFSTQKNQACWVKTCFFVETCGDFCVLRSLLISLKKAWRRLFWGGGKAWSLALWCRKWSQPCRRRDFWFFHMPRFFRRRNLFLGGWGVGLKWSFFFFFWGGVAKFFFGWPVMWGLFCQKNACQIFGKGFDNNYFDRLLGGFKWWKVFTFLLVMYIGYAPLPVTVTTRIISFLVGDPNLNLYLPLASCGHTHDIYSKPCFFLWKQFGPLKFFFLHETQKNVPIVEWWGGWVGMQRR